ncbi:hypothetical protein BXQ17_13530 [Polaribacter sp. BM10]|uniref:hypothetical protein n=1 Tax=Polaribacter sp. BM10 TaxID=1529069 RepID=UPI00098A6BCC|nr:hypothetical protein [Polaribacter sp. BM10]AQS95037.1 hypothetical protein BXQ17_13530 [Polaribacter sp. BM10]
MKKIFIIIALIVACYSNAQETKSYKLIQVDEYPLFKGTKALYSKNRAKFNSFLQKKFLSKVDYKILGLVITDYKFYVEIHIDLNKNVKVINTSEKDKDLHKEIVRVVEEFKVKKAAKLNGKSVAVTFILPFKINSKINNLFN